MSITWKYEQIAAEIRTAIEHGRLRPGDPVPSSRILVKTKNVSRTTAQAALTALAEEGLIHDIAGKGFHVTETPVARLAGRRTAGSSRIESGLPFQIVGKPAFALPPERVRVALGIGSAQRALARTRLMTTVAGEPVAVVTAWFPPDIAAVAELLHRTEPLPGGTTRHILERTGLRPAAGEDRSIPRLATESEARLLGLKTPAAVQDLFHKAWDVTGKVLVCEEGVTVPWRAERVEEYTMTV